MHISLRVSRGGITVLKGKNISVYVTGGIAVYKVCGLVREFIKEGAQVRVAMTEAATEFVSPLTFQILSKNEVYTDLFTENNPAEVAHIHLADWSDIAVLAPATANTIGKLGNGIGDNFVTAALSATDVPLFIVPAMNTKMYNNPRTQDNIKKLTEDGVCFIEPDTGFLAEGYEGKGRYPENERVIAEIKESLIEKDYSLPLKNKKVIVTAGGTIERIDPVRYITNDSSGKMGHHLAEAAYERGAHVTLITASDLSSSRGIKRIDIEAARELYEAVSDVFNEADLLIMAAAVSDYGPASSADQKIKKDVQENETMVIELKENPDILKEMGKRKDSQILVGFAAETENLKEYAQKKLKEKNLDYIVANDVSKEGLGFNVDTNEVIIFNRDGKEKNLPLADKKDIASQIIQLIIDEAE